MKTFLVGLVGFFFFSTTLEASTKYVCFDPHAVTPVSQNESVKTIINAINEVAGGALMTAMATNRGHTFEFCWMQNEGQAHPAFAKGIGTLFWHGSAGDGTKISGIIYTIQTLNDVIKLAKSPETALLPALFVIYHEIGHATIHFGIQTGELANIVKNQATLFLVTPLVSKFKGREAELFNALNGNTWGSETFADCYGAYLMGIAMMYSQGTEVPFYERVSRHLYNEESFRTAMKLAGSIASQLIGQDEHGTKAERESFVAYGVNAAAYYLPFMKSINAERAANSATLACANMAFEQAQSKQRFKTQFGINVEVIGRSFDKTLGY